jgi:hypothetical protein
MRVKADDEETAIEAFYDTDPEDTDWEVVGLERVEPSPGVKVERVRP